MSSAAAADDGDVFGVGVVIALPSSPSFSLENSSSNKKKNSKKSMMTGDADGSVSKKTKKEKKHEDSRDQSKSNNNATNGSSSSSSLPSPWVDKFVATTASASCSFPMSRAWRLVRGEAGNADNRTTHEAVFLINKASEMFLQRFAQEAYSYAQRDRKKSISYHHLSSTVCNGKRYEFLSDFVPEKVKAEDALKARALAET